MFVQRYDVMIEEIAEAAAWMLASVWIIWQFCVCVRVWMCAKTIEWFFFVFIFFLFKIKTQTKFVMKIICDVHTFAYEQTNKQTIDIGICVHVLFSVLAGILHLIRKHIEKMKKRAKEWERWENPKLVEIIFA